ncbi:MAG: hypothetical protein JWM52_621 [Candidatus Saccharibacteria bacterium]|nr:hypothetical protein [Candidatus Saccharibacteria bacterium]
MIFTEANTANNFNVVWLFSFSAAQPGKRMQQTPIITTGEARKLLGTIGSRLSDVEVEELVVRLDGIVKAFLTEVPKNDNL